MNVTVKLADEDRLTNLFLGFLAVHNMFSHDEDLITFERDDGYSLHIRMAVNYVSFGPRKAPENKRFWTENIDLGDMHRLLLMFIRRWDARRRALGAAEGVARAWAGTIANPL